MLVFEAHARWLLVVHALLGAATVALTTHLALWSWQAHRGRRARIPFVRWFAGTALLVTLAQFLLGNVLYPTYRVRVRAEYLDQPTAARAEAGLRAEVRTRVDARASADAVRAARAPVDASIAPAPPSGLPGVARLFDVKEHLAAICLAAIAAAWWVARTWTTAGVRDDRARARGPGALVVSLALVAAACAWIVAVVGHVVTGARAIP